MDSLSNLLKFPFVMKYIIFVLLALFLSSCSSSVDKFGQLSSRVGQFNKAVFWGRVPNALEHVEPDERMEVSRAISSRIKKEKLVDIQIEDINLDENGDSAKVVVVTRYYQSPTYTIMERREEQTWQYVGYNSGWKLQDQYPITEAVNATLPDPSGAMR